MGFRSCTHHRLRPALVNDLACVPEVELLDYEVVFLQLLEGIPYCPRGQVTLLYYLLVGHCPALVQEG
jgi:hypothetical protein